MSEQTILDAIERERLLKEKFGLSERELEALLDRKRVNTLRRAETVLMILTETKKETKNGQ